MANGDWDNENTKQNNDAILSTDDLVLLIGEKEVWIRQKDLLLKMYVNTIKDLSSKLAEAKKLEARCEVLENSNKLLSDKNIGLDRNITELQNTNNSLIPQLTELKSANNLLTVQLADLEKTVDRKKKSKRSSKK